MIQQILKRGGSLVSWDSNKVTVAMMAAMRADGVRNYEQRAKELTEYMLSEIEDRKIIAQEQVQDIIEKILMQEHPGSAKRFILYREKRRQQRETNQVFMDVTKTVNEYIGELDWRVNENANMGFSFQGMVLHLSGSMQAQYVLDQYPEEIRNAHINGDFHIHDLSFGLAGYCSGWSLRDLLLEGFNLKGFCSSAPAKHFDTALSQIINFIGTLQNEFAGAQAFNDVDVYLAPFIRRDKLNYKQVTQFLQRFVFNLNTTSRWGGQTPFSNLTLDLVCPKYIRDKPVIIGGELMKETYGEFQEELDMFNKAFLEVMVQGDSQGRVFSFPIPTYNVTDDFPWDSEIGNLVADMTAKYGIPYFQNFINSDIDPEDVQSMCCRLRIDKKEVIKKTGGLFGAGDLTGSIGVVTVNLPALAYKASNEEEFFELIDYYMELASSSLELKRKMINDNFTKGFYPWARRYLKQGFKGHFSTIGLIGGHEACLNLIGKDLLSKEGSDLIVRTLERMAKNTKRFQEKTGNLYNLEATPAEGTAYRLAKADLKRYPDIIQSGNGDPYYTNSTQFHPENNLGPIKTVIEQEKFQVIYTGGTVVHTYLGEAVQDGATVKNFVKKAFELTKIPYLSVTPTFSICEDHGYLKGEHYTCPKCGKDTECFSRVVGYLRDISKWNKAKKAEWKDRSLFTLDSAPN